jgi:hypothetical protein
LVIEWMAGASPDQFAGAFDDSLRRSNVDYDTKRTGDLGMTQARVTTVAPGAFHRWMESRGKLGGQHKTPRCANHRDFVDGVLGQEPARPNSLPRANSDAPTGV